VKSVPTQFEWVVFSASSGGSSRAHLSRFITDILLFLLGQENNHGQESTVLMGFSLNLENKIAL